MSQIDLGFARDEINMLICPVGGQITRKKPKSMTREVYGASAFKKMLDLPPHRHTNVP